MWKMVVFTGFPSPLRAVASFEVFSELSLRQAASPSQVEMNVKHHQSISTCNGSSTLSSLAVTKCWAANIHDRVLLLIQMICLPGWDWGSLSQSHLQPNMDLLSLQPQE